MKTAPQTAHTQHAPGEWEQRAERDGRSTVHYVKIGTGNFYGVRGVGQTEAEVQANARLIASAPTLLAALEHLEAAATKFTVGCNCQTAGADDTLYTSLEQARAAIAKATQ